MVIYYRLRGGGGYLLVWDISLIYYGKIIKKYCFIRL